MNDFFNDSMMTKQQRKHIAHFALETIVKAYHAAIVNATEQATK